MRILSALLLLFLVSCNFKPPYDRPCMDMPDSFRFKTPDPKPTDECANIRWWEQFQDPELDELIKLALLNNQDLAVATARVLQFYAEYRAVASQLYPQVNATGSYLRQELSEAIDYAPVPLRFRTNNLYTLALNLSYQVDVWSQIWNQTEASIAEYVGEIEVRRTVILTLVSSVASAYVQLRQFDAQLEISKMTYESRLESWKLSQLRYDVGLVSEMEVKQAESEAQSALVQVHFYELAISQQEDLISVLLGEPSHAIKRGSTLVELKQPFEVPSGLPSDLLQNRPDILKAELDLMAANAQIGVARAAFFPAISLTGMFGVQSTSLKHLFKNIAKTWDIGMSFFQPLFTGWLLEAQLLEAEAITLEAIHTYKQTILTAFQEVNDAIIGYQKTKEIVAVQEKQVEALAVYVRLATLRYENGQNDYLTVLDAQRRLFEAQLDLAQNESNVFLNLIDLYKALGGGWVTDADYCYTNPEPSVCP